MASAPVSSEVICTNVTSAHECCITLEAAEALISLSGTTTTQSEPSPEDEEIQTETVVCQQVFRSISLQAYKIRIPHSPEVVGRE